MDNNKLADPPSGRVIEFPTSDQDKKDISFHQMLEFAQAFVDPVSQNSHLTKTVKIVKLDALKSAKVSIKCSEEDDTR